MLIIFTSSSDLKAKVIMIIIPPRVCTKTDDINETKTVSEILNSGCEAFMNNNSTKTRNCALIILTKKDSKKSLNDLLSSLSSFKLFLDKSTMSLTSLLYTSSDSLVAC